MQSYHDEILNIFNDLKTFLSYCLSIRELFFVVPCSINFRNTLSSVFGLYQMFFGQKHCNLNMTGLHASTSFVEPKLREKRLTVFQHIILHKNIRICDIKTQVKIVLSNPLTSCRTSNLHFKSTFTKDCCEVLFLAVSHPIQMLQSFSYCQCTLSIGFLTQSRRPTFSSQNREKSIIKSSIYVTF